MSAGRNPALAALAELGASVWLVWRAGAGLAAEAVDQDALFRARFARALVDHLWRPLPTVLALAALVGCIAGVSGSQILKLYYAELQVAPAIARVLVTQVTPLLVGMFVAGRVSVALAARLGGMRLAGEIDALELRGMEPARFVLSPALGALVLASPILALAVGFTAVSAAGALLRLGAVLPWGRYVELVFTPALAAHMLGAMLKALVFVVLAAAAGAAAGSAPVRDPRQLERRITSAFTGGLLAIFTAAALLAVLFP